MNGYDPDDKPLLWIVDAERAPLAACRAVFEAWADCLYVPWGHALPDWGQNPDAVFFSAELGGGAEGAFFSGLARDAGPVPLLAVAQLRSLAQAVAYFRAGAWDYLSFPLEEDEVRERFSAALERVARLAVDSMMMEVEQVDEVPDSVSLSRHSESTDPQPVTAGFEVEDADEDILAQLSGIAEPLPTADGATNFPAPVADVPDVAVEAEAEQAKETADDEEPVAVDGLPIPSLWDELPCGLLVFDSLSNLVFANRLGLELFGFDSLAELQEALESRRSAFSACSANGKPLPDNQWPQLLAVKTRAARSAVLSLEKPDRRRVWLRVDCMPHLTDGAVSRLSMTLVNLTGELPPPPAKPAAETAAPKQTKKERGKARGKKKR